MLLQRGHTIEAERCFKAAGRRQLKSPNIETDRNHSLDGAAAQDRSLRPIVSRSRFWRNVDLNAQGLISASRQSERKCVSPLMVVTIHTRNQRIRPFPNPSVDA